MFGGGFGQHESISIKWSLFCGVHGCWSIVPPSPKYSQVRHQESSAHGMFGGHLFPCSPSYRSRQFGIPVCHAVDSILADV